MLLRTPGVSAVAILALALGIGANSAIFSVVYAVLLRPLPVRDGGRLVSIQAHNPRLNIPPINPSYNSYGTWKDGGREFRGDGSIVVGRRGDLVRPRDGKGSLLARLGDLLSAAGRAADPGARVHRR